MTDMKTQELRRKMLKALMKGHTQKGFADLYDLDASYLSQLLNGHRSFGERAAANLELKIGVSEGTLVNPVDADSKTPTSDTNGSPLSEGYARIPIISASASAGSGHINDHIEIIAEYAMPRRFLNNHGVAPGNAKLISVIGDSMQPWLESGDMVLIDTAATEPHNGQAYALRRPDGAISIKRLFLRMNGEWEIVSDNPNKSLYPNEIIGNKSCAQVPIIGKVIWRGGALA